MNELRIPIHSVIDVITNSSTEIFTQASDNTIRIIQEVIMDLDMSIDVNKSFNFELEKNESDVNSYLYNYYDEELSYRSDPIGFQKLGWRERGEFITSEIESQRNGTEVKWIDDAMEYYNRDITLVITALDYKGKLLLPIVNKIMSVTKTIKTEEVHLG